MILSSTEARIKQKIEEAGKPLKDWDVNIYRGILTGFNEAFIIDGKTRNDLICKSPESAEIIHPILRGKDVKKYSVSFADLWLINTHNGLRQINTQRINVEHDYPVIFNHLKKYEKQLASREDQGDTWSNLRNCAYLLDFNKPKIIYPEITKYLPFVYD